MLVIATVDWIGQQVAVSFIDVTQNFATEDRFGEPLAVEVQDKVA